MHKALYRIYRPKTFDDIIGQSHIIKVLENQIKTSTLSHAYLFTGPRGTGKTSTAKVLAKAVNCQGEEKPCYNCNICPDSNIDIIELDAASNNSVDNIREIRDNVGFSPNVGKYKIYIIDEVHMLSTGAFNALLKTLEEPPEHVIFILATTEPHKIPHTVLSRCQRFDFKKITQEDSGKLLIEVLEKENQSYEDDAIDFIVKKAEGGMRDALMLLDKSISYGAINLENVRLALGELSQEELEEFAKIIESKNVTDCLLFIEKVDAKGIDLKVFLMDAIEYLKEIMLQKVGAIEANTNINISGDMLASYIQALCEIYSGLKQALTPKIFLQANMVKLLHQGTDVVDNDEIKKLREEVALLREKLEKLERDGVKTTSRIESHKPTSPARPAQPLPEMKEQLSEGEKTLVHNLNQKIKDVVQLLKKEKQAPLAVFLDKGEVARVIENVVVIAYDDQDSFYKNALENGKLPIVEELWNKDEQNQQKLALALKSQLPSLDNKEKYDNTLEMLRASFPGIEIEIK